jgi:hypothetical protein
MDSFFVHTCSFLFALKDAKPARRSFIAQPRAGLTNFNLLPVNLLELSEAETDKVTAGGVRISNLIAKRQVKVKSRTENTVVLD